MPRKVETFFLRGPAGRLEALIEEPEHTAPREAALVCHPHPLYGGTMHNKVVHRVARGLRRAGFAVLRFNFRGVNRSAGAHAHGEGEVEDARSALSWLRARYPELPYTLAGFSFGSRIALRLGCEVGDARRVLALGLPTRDGVPPGLERCRLPKVFIQSTHDQFGPRAELEAVVALLAEPKRLVWIDAADHFFAGALEWLEETVFSLVKPPGAGGN